MAAPTSGSGRGRRSAQWALSHAIYPGPGVRKDDPVVQGHMALMQACTREDVPTETGWLPHEGIWNYKAPFVSHVYLWAGVADWARRTFTGFLNHATPLYCWREEQPTRGSLVGGYIGDMPHNWASAECMLYLRHMLALEDGAICGCWRASANQNSPGVPHRIRVAHTLRPHLDAAGASGRERGWRLDFEREAGPAPASVVLPPGFTPVDPASRKWSATWAV